MFGNECLECAKMSQVVEEKDKKISTFQNNLFEMKSKMVESNGLINIYFTYKNENESLKKELDTMKKKSDNIVTPQVTYEVYSIFMLDGAVED